MAQIVEVTSEVVSIPVTPPVISPAGVPVITHVDNVIVHVDAADGVRGSSYVWAPSGRGASAPMPANSTAFAVNAAVAMLVPHAVGRDVSEYEGLCAAYERLAVTMGGGILGTVYSGLDMALWDAHCKTLGVPLRKLLGGRRSSLPTYGNELLHHWGDDTTEFPALAEKLLARGFTSLKLALGYMSVDAAVERIRVVREAVGPSVGLAVDLNSAYTYDAALAIGRGLEPFGLMWIEDPVPIERVDEYARLCAELDTPIAGGETSYSVGLFRTLLEADALDELIVEPMRIGGITGLLKVIALAEAFGRPISSHVYHNLCAHALSGGATAGFVEYLPWWDVLLEEPAALVGSEIVPADRPGIGIDFRADALKKYRVC